MRVLITGSEGFAGRHLIDYLHENQSDADIFGTIYRHDDDGLLDYVQYRQIDLMDSDAVYGLIDEIRPDAIYHLAAQASPSVALKATWRTLEVNIRTQLNLFETCIHLGLSPRILITSSAEIYCNTKPELMPLVEDAELRPTSPYALSKITQDFMGQQYYISHQLPIIRVRPFNHTGPGQRETFVAPDFAVQIARIEQGLQEPIMRVGNLTGERDFSDVRDTVRAYGLLMKHGKAGEAYNVASNQAFSIQKLLDTLLSLTNVNIEIQIDPNRFRPVDVPHIRGSYDKLNQLTGWKPEISFEQTLKDLLDECRQRVQRISRSN